MRKCNLIVIIFFSLVSIGISQAQVMWQFNKDTVIAWQYEGGDEFNKDVIDTVKWKFSVGETRSIFNNREQQYYADRKNLVEEGGVLKIIAKKEPIEARTVDWMEDNDSLLAGGKYYGPNKKKYNYTSGKIQSTRTFKQGFFEIRFKAPKDKGMWPAFWLAGGLPNEEIDIFELKGERPDKAHVDTHCANDCDAVKTWYGKKVNWGGWIRLNGSLEEGYNIVAAEWQQDYVKFFVNGKCVAVSKVKFDVPKGLIANMAIPSNNGPFHPGPDKDFSQSDPFAIDYIRVWTLSDLNSKAFNTESNLVRTEISRLPSGKVKLKRKNKILFGKKADHKNEGVIVSLLPATGKSFILYILGLEKEKYVNVELKDSNGRTMNIVVLSAFQNKLDFSPLQAGSYKLVISFEGKIAEREIKIN